MKGILSSKTSKFEYSLSSKTSSNTFLLVYLCVYYNPSMTKTYQLNLWSDIVRCVYEAIASALNVMGHVTDLDGKLSIQKRQEQMSNK